MERGKEAGDIYLNNLGPLLLQLKRLYKLQVALKVAAVNGPYVLAKGLKAVYEATLKAV